MSDWASLSDDLLLGLVHAMNNRVTALSAFAELSAMDGEPVEAPLVRREVARMVETTGLVRWLASRSGDEEALEVRGIIDVALAVHEHHPTMRATPCVCAMEGPVLPVRVPRWAFFRLMLLLVDGAKRAANTSGDGRAVISLSGDQSRVRVAARTQEPPGADALALASLCGATLREEDDGMLALALPSLPLVRQAERAAREDRRG